MKKGFVDVSLLLDRSGSMESVKTDTIGGFNSFLEEQKKNTDNDIRINLYQFDDQYQVDYENMSVASAPALTKETFKPRGWTALYDAIGKTINSMGERYSKMSEDERPEKVILVVMTDGEENRSTEFSFDDVQNKITHQQEKYNWKIVFLGSELKSVGAAQSLGISQMNTLHYKNKSEGIDAAYKSLSRGITKLADNSVDLEAYATMDLFSMSDQKEQDKI